MARRALATSLCSCAVALLVAACNAPTPGATDEPAPSGEGPVSSLAAAEPPAAAVEPAPHEPTARQPTAREPTMPTPTSEATLAGASNGFVAALAVPFLVAPRLPPPSEVSLRELMRTEIGPRFGRPEARDELVAVLRALPRWAPPQLEPQWRAIVEAVPDRGPLYETCKQCHLEQRLRFRAHHGALPIQSPDRPRERDRR